MYLTCPMPERHRQMTFEEMLNFDPNTDNLSKYRMHSVSATRTINFPTVPIKLAAATDTEIMKLRFEVFNIKYAFLYDALQAAESSMQPYNEEYKKVLSSCRTGREKRNAEKAYLTAMHQVYENLYLFFDIPKSNGKLRHISAPKPELMNALRELKEMIYSPDKSSMMLADHHTSGFAYIQKRCCKNMVERHQRNESNWFAHFDFHDFFGSTTQDFVMRMFCDTYPFCLFDEAGKAELQKALSLCFLNGGLPQGTPISPLVTNVMMIPFDHQMTKLLNHFAGARLPGQGGNKEGDHFVYTRYADDIYISCRVGFDVKKLEKAMLDMLRAFDAPFTLATEKTHYGSRAGKNWMLGMKLNKDNQITVGHDIKKYAKAQITNYIADVKRGSRGENRTWDLDDVQELKGKFSYYRSIEPEYFDYLIRHYNKKFAIDITQAIKTDIREGITV